MSEGEKTEDQPRDGTPQSSENSNTDSDPVLINDKPLTENMEVHHPHHVTHKKKWGEYLLEFLMLFLAVFLGFVAENIRESSVERHKEKGYIHSIVKDLKTDTSKIAANQLIYKGTLDSLQALSVAFDSVDSGFTTRLYTLFRWVDVGWPDFIYTDATIQQLKNSGGFSLIENKDAIDSIMAYDAEVKKALINEAILGEQNKLMIEANLELINYRATNKQMQKAYLSLSHGQEFKDYKFEKFDFLMTHNPQKENLYYNKLIDYIKGMRFVKEFNYKPLKDRATRLIVFLKKEYHLENE